MKDGLHKSVKRTDTPSPDVDSTHGKGKTSESIIILDYKENRCRRNAHCHNV